MGILSKAEAVKLVEAPKEKAPEKNARAHHAKQLEVEGVTFEVESHNPPMRFHVASQPGFSRSIGVDSAKALVKFLSEALADA